MIRLSELNRKLHIHLGLLVLLFVWLFALSGLILNHGGWKFASFWEQRQEQTSVLTIAPSLLTGSHPEESVLAQLQWHGEIQGLQQSEDHLQFRVGSPGTATEIQIELGTGKGTMKRTTFNLSGKWRTLHTFNGIDKSNAANTPQWLVAKVWLYTMDGIALSLLVISITSWVMWFKARKEFPYGYLVLAGALLLMGYFLLN